MTCASVQHITLTDVALWQFSDLARCPTESSVMRSKPDIANIGEALVSSHREIANMTNSEDVSDNAFAHDSTLYKLLRVAN
jgi:hypothetical protein